MRSAHEIEELLLELNKQPADIIEDQDLDFKEWDLSSMEKSVNLVVKMAICMANGGGGTVVFGVADNVLGYSNAVLGVPPEVDVNQLKRSVYEKTDPKITPVFEELRVSGGSKRLLIMQIYPGIPPYTDTAGRGTVRIGKECQPLTGSTRRKISIETGETDYTSMSISGGIQEHISPLAIELIRELARKEQGPVDLLKLSDQDLLGNLGVLKGKQLTRAGLLLAGQRESLKLFFPGYSWTYLKMENDTKYSNRIDDNDPIPLAINRIEEIISAHNPITTIEQGLFHFEYRAYPVIAIREALLNAFCHADFRLNAPILVKHFPNRIEISNPGGFIGGINPSNILHHQPVPRNPLLVDALLKMRLVNRSNLGISRMYEALLIEGKEPPHITESGDSVCVCFMHREFSIKFRMFVEETNQKGIFLGVDELIILQYLLNHAEVDTIRLAQLCQREESRMKDILSKMEQNNWIERGGTGRGTYWVLCPRLHKQIATIGQPERDRRIAWEAAKVRIYSILKERAKRGEEGLSNTEIRQITHYDRQQVTRLMIALRHEHPEITSSGRGPGAHYKIK